MATLALSLETLRRKLTRSLLQRGFLPTLRRCVTRPIQGLISATKCFSPRQRRVWREECEFDRKFNVKTQADRDPGWMAAIASPNWMHGIGYAPVPAADLEAILHSLDLPWRDYTFVDLGAGKGRALFVAAEYPFRQCVGVEYSPRLIAAMQNNIASYRNYQQRCGRLVAELGDAAEYEFPTDPLVLFLHHPFEAVVLQQVIKRLEASVDKFPRHILVIYYDPQCDHAFAQSTTFKQIGHGTSSPHESPVQWVVYEAKR